jgi:hypothetical protein
VNWLKAFACLVILAITAGSLKLWSTTVFYGGYLDNAGLFMAIMACAAPVFAVAVAFYAVKFVIKAQPSDFNL